MKPVHLLSVEMDTLFVQLPINLSYRTTLYILTTQTICLLYTLAEEVQHLQAIIITFDEIEQSNLRAKFGIYLLVVFCNPKAGIRSPKWAVPLGEFYGSSLFLDSHDRCQRPPVFVAMFSCIEPIRLRGAWFFT